MGSGRRLGEPLGGLLILNHGWHAPCYIGYRYTVKQYTGKRCIWSSSRWPRGSTAGIQLIVSTSPRFPASNRTARC